MPDPNIAPPDKWTAIQQWLAAIAASFGTAAASWSLARASAAKKKGGQPVAWEKALEEIRMEMAESRRVAIEARDDTRMLREREVHMLNNRMERIETQAMIGNDEVRGILQGIINQLASLKRLYQSSSKPQAEIPE